MRAPLLLLLAAAAVGCGGGDPCAPATGSCLAIRVRGEIEPLTTMLLELDGALSRLVPLRVPEAPRRPPFAIGVLLPEGYQGEVAVLGFGYSAPCPSPCLDGEAVRDQLAGGEVALGQGRFEIGWENRPRLELPMRPVGDPVAAASTVEAPDGLGRR